MNVDQYLDAAPEPHQTSLRKLRSMLAAIVADAEEGMSYGVPALKVNGKAVAGFAHASKHCSYLPHSGSVIEQVEAKLLESYKYSKGSLRFPVDQVPAAALLRRLVELRLTERER